MSLETTLHTPQTRRLALVRPRTHDRLALGSTVLIVFASQLAFALWMNHQDYLWGDAISRSSAALIALFGADPHLAAIGFVWMPLPTFLMIPFAAIYPYWHEVVASGFASSIVTVLCGVLTAAIVYGTARKLGLSELLGASYALVVSFSPMLFLFFTNGMSEGVAAPFMIGSVCCLLLFWNDGQRRYVAASGIMLALAFACLYQAVNFGAALLACLVIGMYTAENVRSEPQGRLRSIEGLGILFLVPSIYVGILWVIANAVIMGDPLYFATSIYSNEGYISATGMDRLADKVAGDIFATLWFSIIRTAPFTLPIAAILLVRLIGGRLLRVNSLLLTGLALVVPFGLITMQLYNGDSFGWLRYFHYPLFVAAGWGLYEISKSERRGIATAIVFTGWLLAFPASLWAMADPEMGQNENAIVRSIFNGKPASESGYPLYYDDIRHVSAALDRLPSTELVLADASNAWTIAATVSRDTLKHKLLLTSDDRFHDALEDPAAAQVRYLLVPDPGVAPQDLLLQEYPGLWAGTASGFTLATDFSDTGLNWRLYRVDATP